MALRSNPVCSSGRLVVALFTVVATAMIGLVPPAHADATRPPPAHVIDTLPYSDVRQTDEIARSDARARSRCNAKPTQTVWYEYRADRRRELEVHTVGSNYDTTVSVFTWTEGELRPVSCNDDWVDEEQSRLYLEVEPGVRYFFAVSAAGPSQAGDLRVYVNRPPAETSFGFKPRFIQGLRPQTGHAVVDLPVECSAPVTVVLRATLLQKRPDETVSGSEVHRFPCNASTVSTVLFRPTTGAFRPGEAVMTGTLQACYRYCLRYDLETGMLLAQPHVAQP